MCQGCVDEGRLSQKTYDAIEAFCEQWPGADCGPAHLVLGDDNVDDQALDSCLQTAQEKLKMALADWNYSEYGIRELNATLAFLQDLRRVPEDER